MAEAQLKWSSQHHIGARLHPVLHDSVYLSQLAASEFCDRTKCEAPAHIVRVQIIWSGRASSRRSTMRGTPSSRGSKMKLLLRFCDSATCN